MSKPLTDAVSLLGVEGIGENDNRLKRVESTLKRKLTPNEKQASVSYAKELFRPMVNKVLDRNQMLFWQKHEQVLTTDEKGSLDAGALELKDGVLYLRKNIHTSAEKSILTSNDKELAGICSYANQRTKTPFQITGIAIGYGEDASSATNAASIKYLYDDSVPAEIQNATLVISQSKGGELIRFELSRLFKRTTSSGNLSDHIFHFTAPKYLRTDATIDMKLILPDSVTIVPITALSASFLNVELFGNALVPKITV